VSRRHSCRMDPSPRRRSHRRLASNPYRDLNAFRLASRPRGDADDIPSETSSKFGTELVREMSREALSTLSSSPSSTLAIVVPLWELRSDFGLRLRLGGRVLTRRHYSTHHPLSSTSLSTLNNSSVHSSSTFHHFPACECSPHLLHIRQIAELLSGYTVIL
jgi:hypothetical protein